MTEMIETRDVLKRDTQVVGQCRQHAKHRLAERYAHDCRSVSMIARVETHRFSDRHNA
jgi:hypothetical protein